MKRVALCGIGSENCTFSPDRLGVEDFAIHEGRELNERYAFAADGTDQRIEAVNLMMARALPGGPIRCAAYEELVGKILHALQEGGPWDAVYLDLHGAMHVETMVDAEDDFVRRVTDAVGSECRLGASFDLHGNLSSRLACRLETLSTYRTAPHVDEYETRARAFRLLCDRLHTNRPSFRTWIPIPVLLPGECTSTQYDPGKSLYGELEGLEAEFGLDDLSLFVGYAWADEQRSTACVVATGEEAEACEKAAMAVASGYWNARSQFAFGMPALPMAEAIDAAVVATERPAVISDSGDNPTAGGVGNLVVALRAVLDGDLRGESVLLAGIWDAESTQRCFEVGDGAELTLAIGSAMPSDYGEPVVGQFRVQGLWTGETEAERQVIVSPVESPNVRVVLTERRKPFHYRHDFLRLGIEPESVGILIVKIGYLVPDLFDLAKQHWLALSPGAVDQDLARLPYERIVRPVFPMDRDFDWQPEQVMRTWQIGTTGESPSGIKPMT